MNHSKRKQRASALALSGVMALGCALPAAAAGADGPAASYDEAYYATLDYYGNLTDGSVVKSYVMNGASRIVDYGVYDEVTNLSNTVAPSTAAAGQTSFDFGTASPAHFYFQGKTAKPYEEAPWTLSLSYMLNGVPTAAEELAGKTGVVEIAVDAVPNPKASAYARQNYTLEAMALFNQDDILSLEAPGAQVQLIGNLRAVVFLALPGQTEHFILRVGTEDFSFDGMTILMVPATLGQLEQVAELAQRKDELEDDYEKLSGSLDALLDSLDTVSGDLLAAAAGLDALNGARAAISAGKGGVYDKADALRAGLDAVNDSLAPVAGDLDNASAGIGDMKEVLGALTGNVVALKDDLGSLEGILGDLEENTPDLTGVLADLDGVSGAMETVRGSKDDLDALLDDLDGLQTALGALRADKGGVDAVLAGLDGLQTALDALRADRGDADALLADVGELQTALDALRGGRDSVDAVLSDLGGLQTALDALRGGRDSVDAVLDDLGGLQTTLDALRGGKGDADAVLADLTKLQTALDALRGGKGDADALLSDLTGLQRGLDALRDNKYALDVVIADLGGVSSQLSTLSKALGAGGSAGLTTIDANEYLTTILSLSGGDALYAAYQAAVGSSSTMNEAQFIYAATYLSTYQSSGDATAAKAKAEGLSNLYNALVSYNVAIPTDLTDTSAITALATTIGTISGDVANAGDYAKTLTAMNIAYLSAAGSASTVDFSGFLTAMEKLLTIQAAAETDADKQAALKEQAEEIGKLKTLYDSVIKTVGDLNGSIGSANTTLSSVDYLSTLTARLLSSLSTLCTDLGALQTLVDDGDALAGALSGLSADAAKLGAVLDNADALMAALSGLSADAAKLGAVLDDADALLASLGGLSGDIAKLDALLDDGDRLLAAISAMSGDAAGLDGLLDDADALLASLGGLSGDAAALRGLLDGGDGLMAALGGMCADLSTLSLQPLLDSAAELAGLGRGTTGKLSAVADDVDSLYGVLDTYEPAAQEALRTVGGIVTAARDTLKSTGEFADALEDLMKTSGQELDEATRQSLTSLASSLRSVAASLDTTDSVRDAKDAVREIVEDTWNEHTGEFDTLLLMDATAEAVSLTDPRNPAPESVQIMLRTQEIKGGGASADSGAALLSAGTADGGSGNGNGESFWSRLGQMFSDLWAAIVGLVHIGPKEA